MSPGRFSLFALAKDLGKTVGELVDQLTVEEFQGWLQFYKQLNEEPEPPTATPEDFMKAFGQC